MGISWLTALKAVPWSEVIEATPALVKGARRLMKRSADEAEGTTTAAAGDAAAAPQTLGDALARLRRLEAELAGLEQRQAEGAALLQELAEQNARLVAAVEQLRQRGRLLLTLCGLSSAAAVAAFAWALLR